MADASTLPTDMSSTVNALAVPEILSYILVAPGKRYLPKFRLVSHSFLQACAPFFYIRIPDSYGRSALSSDHLEIIQDAGRLLRSLSLATDDSASFDAFASSLRLQSLRLTFDNPTPTSLPTHHIYGPLFKEGATLGTHLTELGISIWGDSYKGTVDKWNTHCSPRCLLDPESGMESPLGLIFSRLSALEIVNVYQYDPHPMRWSTMVDILRNVCPRLTKLKVGRIPLELTPNATSTSVSTPPFNLPPQVFPSQDVYPAITTLLLDTTSLTIQGVIQLNDIFPSVERVNIRIKEQRRPLPPIDRSVVLSFKTVTLTCIDSTSIVALLPILPRVTSLSIEQYTGELDMPLMVQAFKDIGGRNKFKLLAFPFSWNASDLRVFMQLECLWSLESLELWNSSKAFLEAIGVAESLESQVRFEISTPPPSTTATITPKDAATVTTTTPAATKASASTIKVVATPAAVHTHALPVFLDTIQVLRLKVYKSRRSTNLTTTHASILNGILKKMPRLEHFSLQRELLPDLSIFDGLEKNQPPLRYLRIAVAASTGPLISEMVSAQILDRYVPGLENVNISLEGPRAIMERPWVKKLSRWFDSKNESRSEYDLTNINLCRCYWG
ncbi:hypothetical protein BGZ96_010205 [Linnemannia gamsii]|uniref:F-box domain-containing protein n=1 Tax=Linnemannia gamsii TaxID=64522 RepID=A0ABQ7JV63_9FUNG|nr:hypothetical protein BGZ96_010205 [Linnemannia gamsii]